MPEEIPETSTTNTNMSTNTDYSTATNTKVKFILHFSKTLKGSYLY